jgi:radical SAM superfamily enzyme YgiQ (UPF0313 family)
MIFIVDDNFIGNKREVKKLLPEMKAWNNAHGDPFVYYTEATVNLADDEDLLKQMIDADFKAVFVGIETPSLESLKETKKYQNMKRSLVDSVQVIQNAGLLVQGGFIIGFDSDGDDIFDRQIEFIRQTAIPHAMVGLLTALPGTPLYKRLEQAGRLELIDYDRVVTQIGFTNIVTLLPRRKLLEGYHKVIETLYTPSEYFKRSLEFLCRLPRPESMSARMQRVFGLFWHILSGFTTKKIQNQSGILARLKFLCDVFRQLPADYKREALKFIWAVLKRCPDQLPRSVPAIFSGVHFYRFSFENVLPELDMKLAQLIPESTKKDEKIASLFTESESAPVARPIEQSTS